MRVRVIFCEALCMISMEGLRLIESEGLQCCLKT